MHAGIARQSFKNFCVIPQLSSRFFGRERAFQLGIFFNSGIKGGIEIVRYHLRDPIGIAVTHAHHAADIAHHALRFQFSKGNDLRDPAFAVFLANVFEHFTPPCFAKIHRVDVRHRDALGIQKAFEDQSVLQWIDVGNAHHVGHHRAGRRTAAWPNRNAAPLREMDEVPNNEDVADETGLLENLDLTLQTLLNLVIASSALAVTLVQTFLAKFSQITLARFPFRHRILRIFRTAEFQIEMAAFADFERVRDCFRKIAEQFAHFLRRFEIKLRHVMHALLVLHHFAGADAKHHVVRLVIGSPQKMHVVRGDQADPQIFRELRQHTIASVLFLDSVIVQLDEEIFRAENVAILSRGLFRMVELVRLNRGIDFAGETTAQADQTRGVRCQKLLIDPRPVVKPVEMRGGNEFNQIAISGFVLRQQSEMIRRVAHRIRPIFVRSRRDVRFAANDRFDPGFGRLLIKLNRAEKIAVICHRDRGHLEFHRSFHQLLHPDRAIEERVFGMEVEMNEGVAGHLNAL